MACAVPVEETDLDGDPNAVLVRGRDMVAQLSGLTSTPAHDAQGDAPVPAVSVDGAPQVSALGATFIERGGMPQP